MQKLLKFDNLCILQEENASIIVDRSPCIVSTAVKGNLANIEALCTIDDRIESWIYLSAFQDVFGLGAMGGYQSDPAYMKEPRNGAISLCFWAFDYTMACIKDCVLIEHAMGNYRTTEEIRKHAFV